MAGGLFFVGLSIYIGMQAKRDADSMEIAWVYLEMMPDIKERLSSHRVTRVLSKMKQSLNKANAADARTSRG